MDEIKAPETLPTLALTPASFEIVFADDPNNPLALTSPPISDLEEMKQMAKLSYSLKTDGGYTSVFRAAAGAQLDGLLEKVDRFHSSATFNNRLANLHSALGDPASEELAAKAAFESSPSSLLARKVADATLRLGDVDRANVILQRIASEDSGAALRLAALEVKSGNLVAAESWIELAVRSNPWGYSERLFQGALYLVQKKFKSAIGILKMALEERPNSSSVYANLGFAYLGEGQHRQAFNSLKRAIVMDPFNRTALLAYADLGSRLGSDDDTVSSLRYFVEFEQKDAAVWERLARSHFKLGMYDDAIFALKQQGAVRQTAGVWNNLGVAYARKKDPVRAMQSFRQALQSESDGGLHEDLLIAKNAAALVSTAGRFEEVLVMTGHIVSQDPHFELAKDAALCDVYSLHMHALLKTGSEGRALSLAERILEVDGLAGNLLRWIVTTETSYRGLHRDDDEKLGRLLKLFGSLLGPEDFKDMTVANNIAYACAELGRTDEAMHYLSLASQYVHVNPYPTATLGLICMRKGRYEKGVALYDEAVGLARTHFDKARIRQKMNLELAKHYLATEPRRATRLLERVADEKGGEQVFKRQALLIRRTLVQRLGHP